MIPPATGHIHGREADLARVRTAFDRGARLVTLTGPAGVGKTRLAGVVLAAVGGGIWVDARPCTTGADLRDALERAFAAHPADYAVVDNLEQIAEVAGEVLEAWTGPVRWIATSRKALGVPGEHRVPMGPLDTTAARAVYLDRVAAVLGVWPPPDAEDPRLDPLLRQLDQLPLAIELAASRRRVVSLDALLATPPLARVDAPVGARRSLVRSLRASWALLGPEDRATLVRLAVFAGTFRLEDAEAVLPPGEPVFDRLAQLVDASMVNADAEGRLSLLAVVRAFALAQASEPGLHDPRETTVSQAPSSAPTLAEVAHQAREAHATWFAGPTFLGRLQAFRRSGDPSHHAWLSRAAEEIAVALRYVAERRIGHEAASDARFEALADLDFSLSQGLATFHATREARAWMLASVPLTAHQRQDIRRHHAWCCQFTGAYAEAADGFAAVATEATGEWAAVLCLRGASLAQLMLGHLPEAERTIRACIALHACHPPNLGALRAAQMLQVHLAQTQARVLDAAERSWLEGAAEGPGAETVRVQLGIEEMLRGRLDIARQLLGAALDFLLARQDRVRSREILAELTLVHAWIGLPPPEVEAPYLGNPHARTRARLRTATLWRAFVSGETVDPSDADLFGFSPPEEFLTAPLRIPLRALTGADPATEARWGGLEERAATLGFHQVRMAYRVARAHAAHVLRAPAVDVLDPALPWEEAAFPTAWARLVYLRDTGTVGAAAALDTLATRAHLRDDAPLRRVTLRSPRQWVAADGSAFHGLGDRVDLGRRPVLRRLVAALAGGTSLDVEGLFAAGWPGERASADAARNRVHVHLSTLRGLGLPVSSDDGTWRLTGMDPRR